MRRTVRLGTFVTLVGMAVFTLIGSMGRQNRGTLEFEADARGKIHAVERGGLQPQKGALPPLWKPEPALLLEHAKWLGITEEQAARIAAEDRLWRSEKAGLLQAMAGYEPTRDGRPVQGISESLQSFATLSRTYDAARSERWTSALDKLTPSQRQAVERLRAPGGIR